VSPVIGVAFNVSFGFGNKDVDIDHSLFGQHLSSQTLAPKLEGWIMSGG
jgi:hypothetical protein